MATGENVQNKYVNALNYLCRKVKFSQSGAICQIEIEEAINLTNLEKQVIWFEDHEDPHVGLHFSGEISPIEILEAKNLLAFLATQNFSYISSLNKNSSTVSLISVREKKEKTDNL